MTTMMESDASYAVQCSGVEKSFQAGESNIRVLRGADFWAREGEMTFLVGPSGCGKTTLISILGAILSSDGGDISVLGEDLRAMSRGRFAQFRLQNLGFIFQQFNLIPSLSARENASLPLVAKGMSTSKAEARASELLAQLGLGAETHKMPTQLSGGQQQRVAIARALVHEPRLVICDEPTASLDASSGQTVMSLLQDIALSEGRAVLIVTHDSRIFRFADVVHHMSDGRISKTETGEQAAESGVL